MAEEEEAIARLRYFIKQVDVKKRIKGMAYKNISLPLCGRQRHNACAR